MNKLSFKKFLPGLVSVIIIAGMAVQSFATNIDLAAFVNKDKYMTKYYELDWRIKDINNRLDRLYKFVCKNVKTYAGTGESENTPAYPFYFYSFNSYSNDQERCYTFLDDPKALRVNKRYLLTYRGTAATSGSWRYHTNTFEKEIPASLCKWRSGIELLPNTKVKITLTDQLYGNRADTYWQTIVMGPFKKVPKFTAGSTQSTGYICELPFTLVNSTYNWTNGIEYAYNRETEPTSWTTFGSDVQSYTYGYYYSGASSSQYPALTAADFENGDIALGKKSRGHTMWYFTSGTIADISSRTNVWIRIRYGISTESNNYFAAFANLHELNLTSWNNNK